MEKGKLKDCTPIKLYAEITEETVSAQRTHLRREEDEL
jgi:hypothetical protein